MTAEIGIELTHRPLVDRSGLPTQEFREQMRLIATVANSLEDLSGDSDDVSEGNAQLFLTNAQRAKIDGVESGAQANVQGDWDEVDTSSDAFIQNKPDGILLSDGSVAMAAAFRLDAVTVATAPTGAEGDMIYVSDGDSGSPCLAIHNGTNWLRVALGAAIST